MDCEHRDTKENISSTLKVLKNFHISCDIAYFSILHRYMVPIQLVTTL